MLWSWQLGPSNSLPALLLAKAAIYTGKMIYTIYPGASIWLLDQKNVSSFRWSVVSRFKLCPMTCMPDSGGKTHWHSALPVQCKSDLFKLGYRTGSAYADPVTPEKALASLPGGFRNRPSFKHYRSPPQLCIIGTGAHGRQRSKPASACIFRASEPAKPVSGALFLDVLRLYATITPASSWGLLFRPGRHITQPPPHFGSLTTSDKRFPFLLGVYRQIENWLHFTLLTATKGMEGVQLAFTCLTPPCES